MTVTEHIEQEPEARESGLLRRTFPAEMSTGDGRTLDVRIVPYGETAIVDDGRGPFTEEFVRGAFDDQLVAGHRLKVYLNFEHKPSITAIVGKGISLRDESDGLHGTFRVLDDQDGDKALTLVNEELLDSVSLEFRNKKSVRTAQGVVRRMKAHLDAVALCRFGAYTSAKVLAVREAQIIDEELLPVDPDPELLERCRQLGIELPQRYQAHPDEPDTSLRDTSETATAEDATSTSEDSDERN